MTSERGSGAVELSRDAAPAARARASRRALTRCAAACLLAGIALGWTVLLPGPADAAECGGGRKCRCGDQVIADYTLTEDLGPCEKHGLRVRHAVLLDGNGHLVRGRGAPDSYGVQVDGKGSGARIRNLGVTGFERGIRLVKVERVRIEAVAAHDNGDVKARVGYGIDLAGGSSRNVLQRVQVFRNADEGIHVGSGAHENRIVEAEVHDNGRENVYFLRNHGNVLAHSTVRGAVKAAVYVKHTARTVLEGNTIEGAPVHLRGDSRDTRLIDNTLRGGGVVLQRYRDKDAKIGVRAPTGTIVRGGSIAGVDACVRIEGATETVLENVALECRQQVSLDDAVVSVLGARVDAVRCVGTGRVEQVRRVEVRFVDSRGVPLAGAELRREGGDAVIGVANANGIYAGLVVESLIECPGARSGAPQGVNVRADGRERKLTALELRGDVTL